MQELIDKVRRARRIYICGNGGSAANALHMANDLVLCGLKAHALTGDIATFSAIANDYGYEQVFARQIEVFGEPQDLLIAMSGSGKSKNILNAVLMAEEIGMEIHTIYGAEQGLDMQTSEEQQLEISHHLMREFRK